MSPAPLHFECSISRKRRKHKQTQTERKRLSDFKFQKFEGVLSISPAPLHWKFDTQERRKHKNDWLILNFKILRWGCRRHGVIATQTASFRPLCSDGGESGDGWTVVAQAMYNARRTPCAPALCIHKYKLYLCTRNEQGHDYLEEI